MMERIIIGYGNRIADDPAALVHLRHLETLLDDQVNRGIFEANKGSRYSQPEIGAMLGVSRQAISKRIKLGTVVYALLQQARGAGAVVRLGDVRAQRAELLGAAGVDDRTGSVRELRSRAG
ncbi:MAG TPA: hypothetical protein VGH54_28125 [Mycobacterium sp.]|jgi:hypothetical protein|uniref:hypothetical protein n=1 Tax=Mycobacterium sp. TaxID=1785 RepID=UPI002F42FBD6